MALVVPDRRPVRHHRLFEVVLGRVLVPAERVRVGEVGGQLSGYVGGMRGRVAGAGGGCGWSEWVKRGGWVGGCVVW